MRKRCAVLTFGDPDTSSRRAQAPPVCVPKNNEKKEVNKENTNFIKSVQKNNNTIRYGTEEKNKLIVTNKFYSNEKVMINPEKDSLDNNKNLNNENAFYLYDDKHNKDETNYNINYIIDRRGNKENANGNFYDDIRIMLMKLLFQGI